MANSRYLSVVKTNPRQGIPCARRSPQTEVPAVAQTAGKGLLFQAMWCYTSKVGINLSRASCAVSQQMPWQSPVRRSKKNNFTPTAGAVQYHAVLTLSLRTHHQIVLVFSSASSGGEAIQVRSQLWHWVTPIPSANKHSHVGSQWHLRHDGARFFARTAQAIGIRATLEAS